MLARWRCAGRPFVALLLGILISGCVPAPALTGSAASTPVWSLHEPGDFLHVLPGTPHAFDGVVAAIFLDSLVVVAEEGTRQLHAFNARSLGRVWVQAGRGERPGQFELLADMARVSGGRIAALDAHLDRLTIFNAAGEFETLVPLELAPADVEYTRVAGFCDGTFAVATQESGASWPGPGISRGESEYYRVDSAGKLINELGRFPGEERLVTADPRMIGSVPFGRRTVVATDCETLFVANGTRFEVEAVYRDGRRGRRVTPAELVPRRVSSRDVESYRRQLFLHVVPESLDAAMRQHIAQLKAPAYFPAHRNLLVDVGGLIWLEEFPSGTSRAIRWFISESFGSPVATLYIDHRIRLVAASHDRVLAVETMPDGRQRVGVYALTRWNR